MAFHDQHSASSVRTKRRPAATATSETSAPKRRRRHAPAPPPASRASFQSRSKLSTRRSAASNGSATSTAPTSSSSMGTELDSKEKKRKAIAKATDRFTLFSRYADPSVQSPQYRPLSSVDLGVSYSSKYNPSSIETPPRNRQQTEAIGASLSNDGEVDEVVDLIAVEHVGSLKMVEGDDILQTLMRTSTPRVKRRFPSEEALTNSEQQERDALRRRRLKLRSHFSVMKDEQSFGDPIVRSPGFKFVQISPETEKGHFATDEHALEAKVIPAGGVRIDGGRVENDERAQLMEEEAETDEETTESKVNRLSKVMHLNWRQFILRIVSGAVLLCTMVVAAPFVKRLLEPSLPYCDSEWTEVNEVSYVLADPVDSFNRSKALQPFIGTSSIVVRASVLECQPCPVHGNCLNGSVISCAPPYELQHGLCKESLEVQANLDRVAHSIQSFIVEKAAKNVCNNAYINFDNKVKPTDDIATSTKIWVSDIQIFVTRTFSFGKAVSNLPREYVFNRALDMVLRELKDIFVTEDQSQLVVGGNVVPWPCRAKHQLYAYKELIALAIALGTALVFAYRQFFLYRTERQLVDRFVKEVRFFLLDRTRRPDRFYPAEHLRDDLFEKQSLQDRTWLCKSVWPKVAAVVNDDSRIKTRVMRVRGEDVVVWEWASSLSPNHRRNRGRGSCVSSKPQQEIAGPARPVLLRRRKKGSRMSLPW